MPAENDLAAPPLGPGHQTVVALCPHPDDETLLIGGTLARAAAAGHRVVIVLATDGAEGLAEAGQPDLRATRHEELNAAATILGASSIVRLGYQDSGFTSPDVPAEGSLAATPVVDVVRQLSRLLADLQPNVLIIPDQLGGYGHRDHVACHRAGAAAAEQIDGLRVLQATLPREHLRRVVRILNLFGARPGGVRAEDLSGWYTPIERITHTVDVRPQLAAKKRALAAHRSQMGGGQDIRTVKLLARLPPIVDRWVLGTEWFVDRGTASGAGPLAELFEPGPGTAGPTAVGR